MTAEKAEARRAPGDRGTLEAENAHLRELLALRPHGYTGSLDDRIPWFIHCGISHGADRPECIVCRALAADSRPEQPAPTRDLQEWAEEAVALAVGPFREALRTQHLKLALLVRPNPGPPPHADCEICEMLRADSRPEQPLCLCCESGTYCRHACTLHPKPNGISDSGKPWADSRPEQPRPTEAERRRAIIEIVESADAEDVGADGIADALLDEADRWAVRPEEPPR